MTGSATDPEQLSDGQGQKAQPTERERHALLTDLYKFYITQTIEFHKFYIPTVGALVAYILDNVGHNDIVVWAVWFPAVVSAGAAIVFGAGIRQAVELKAAISVSSKVVGILAAHTVILVRTAITFTLLHVFILIAAIAVFVQLSP